MLKLDASVNELESMKTLKKAAATTAGVTAWGNMFSLREIYEHWVSMQRRTPKYKQALHKDAKAERKGTAWSMPSRQEARMSRWT